MIEFVPIGAVHLAMPLIVCLAFLALSLVVVTVSERHSDVEANMAVLLSVFFVIALISHLFLSGRVVDLQKAIDSSGFSRETSTVTNRIFVFPAKAEQPEQGGAE